MAGETQIQGEDWTQNAAKTGAVFVLGAVCAAGVFWGMMGRDPRPDLRAARQGEVASAGAERRGGAAVAETPAGRAAGAKVDGDEMSGVVGGEPPTVVMPTRGSGGEERGSGSSSAAVAPLAARKVNLNSAGAAELEGLPGIGPAMAAAIIAWREREGPFKTVEDLDKVPRIGPRTMERLRPLVTVE